MALSRPKGIPDDVGEHIRLMFDLIALSFQCDATRICTFMYANEGSNRNYPCNQRHRRVTMTSLTTEAMPRSTRSSRSSIDSISSNLPICSANSSRFQKALARCSTVR